jgi:hypothetical protein
LALIIEPKQQQQEQKTKQQKEKTFYVLKRRSSGGRYEPVALYSKKYKKNYTQRIQYVESCKTRNSGLTKKFEE